MLRKAMLIAALALMPALGACELDMFGPDEEEVLGCLLIPAGCDSDYRRR